MPGRVMMDQQKVIGSQDPKKDRSKAQEAQTSQKRDTLHTNGVSQHTPDNSAPKEAGVHGQPPVLTNGHSAGASTAVASSPQPPLLDQSWRTSDANKSMGVLIDRTAQLCFEELNSCLNQMAEITATQKIQSGGVITHPTNDTSEASLTKKRKLLDFARGQRDRFIKTLVLSDWARDVDDMAQLVDIKVWQEKQSTAQRNAINFIGITKLDTMRSKMPNPNIEGAMELLSTGKASKWPDMGYIPPKKLTAKTLLKTLQDMNVLLATRLNLHEELPAHFSDFSIANGRATFLVPGEFEVDLSVAGEDPTSSFYFIDIRFLFTPRTSVSDDSLRKVIEDHTNIALANKGLQGCYDFLHNFVLTHKMNVLKSQAVRLHHEKWFDCVAIQTMNRVLTLQYWRGRRGPKSWIELGVSTGKRKGKNARRPPTSQHSVRWFRQGREVENEPLKVDWNDLNLDAVLASVTAKHASSVLRSIKDRLQALAGTNSKLDAQLSVSDQAPENCLLVLSLPGLPTPTTVQFEHISGHLSISPPTRTAANIERVLNSDPNEDASRALSELLCRTIQGRVMQAASLAGWQPINPTTLALHPNFKAMFGHNVIRHSIYFCKKGWAGRWALYITFGLGGERWYIVRIDDRSEQGTQSKTIAHARELSLPADLVARSDFSRASLLQVEGVAEAEVSFAVLTQELVSSNIIHRTERLVPLTLEEDSSTEICQPRLAVYFDASDASPNKSPRHRRDALATADLVRATPRGVVEVDDDRLDMRHEVRLTVDPGKYKDLRQHLSVNGRNTDIAMNDSGALALRIRTPFGQALVEQVKSRILRCQYLDNYLGVLRTYKWKCRELGISRLKFVYEDSSGLEASLSLGDVNSAANLKLEPMGLNPHERIRMHLEKLFNLNRTSLAYLGATLQATLPLLRFFERTESKDPSGHTFRVHVHHAQMFTIGYRSPLPTCVVDIALKMKRDPGGHELSTLWQISPVLNQPKVAPPHDLRAALIELSQSKSEHWFGDMKGNLFAALPGLDETMQRLDDTVRTFESTASTAVEKEKMSAANTRATAFTVID